MDLAEESKVAALEQQIRNLNPVAPTIRTTQGRVDLSQVLNTGAYNSFKVASIPQAEPHAHPNDHAHEHDAECHQHDLESISSVQVSLTALSESQISKLDEWIRSVLWEEKLPGTTAESHNLEVLRCKGIYHAAGRKSYILQGVQTLYDVTELPEGNSEGEIGEGKLVLIGRGLTNNVAHHLRQYLGLQ